MQTIKLTFISIFALMVGVSCTSQKTIISQNQYETQKAVEVAKVEQMPSSTLMIEAAHEKPSPVLYASASEVIHIDEANNETAVELKKEKINAMLDKVVLQKNESKTIATTRKANFVEKLIIKKIEKKMKKSGVQSADFHSWNPNLKIGVILLGVGIVLAIFGLGVVGGISAFIGLLFVILGLLQEV